MVGLPAMLVYEDEKKTEKVDKLYEELKEGQVLHITDENRFPKTMFYIYHKVTKRDDIQALILDVDTITYEGTKPQQSVVPMIISYREITSGKKTYKVTNKYLNV